MCNNGQCGQNQQGGGCCGAHKMGCGWGHKSVWCWLIGLVVLIIVFCTGYKLGVLRGYFGGYYGMYNGGMYYRGGVGGNWGPGMMRNWQFDQTVQEQSKSATNTEK